MSTDFTPSANWLSHEYRDLNGTAIETLEEPPSALEFMRLVHISRPVIIKGYQFPALKLWNEEYLGEKMGDRQVSVAVTPNGLADSITRGPDGRLYFVEPSVDKMSMKELLSKLGPNRIDTGEICYLQSQNGNLFSSDSSYDPESDPSSSDFEPLTSDVPRDVPWCSDALGERPDAVNLWIGDERSITSIHSDPYENIYTVVRGEKHFFLLPPTDSWCLKESLYPHANYSRRSPLGTLELIPSPEDVPEVRWSSILDPELPTALPKEVVPIRVTLHAGETLYLPVGWWHYVQQSGLTIALNWWYDAEMRGMSWVLLNFLRNPVQLPSGNGNSIAQLAPS
ncbi:hypothetical protein GALMADRAFT_236088 [Galerina marginata CBS 339.88]|uniref:JmjC domain-containing protein n=1 Tax=Galerina marginata (strain CBS 339.88) TaxID=685588 RepID=A0A067TKP2_GALM3|nr:hypothetical protein GALMADRAFT_236088 [Galerina marginata CBS 339.88]